MDGQITRLAGWLTTLFTSIANQVARDTGFMKRKRTVTGDRFVQTLVLGWLRQPQATLDDFAEDLGVSPSALQKRFTERSTALLRTLLERAVAWMFETTQTLRTSLTDRFTGIWIEDATSISLPGSLRGLFRGCGGATSEQGAAGMKLLLRLEALTGRLAALAWDRQSENDLNLARRLDDPPAGALLLADLGFWDLKRLRRFVQNGIHWITRVPSRVTLGLEGLARQTLGEFLQQQTEPQVDVWIRLGAQELPCRLVAVRCSQEVASEKKRRLRKKMKKKGKQPSQQQLACCEWLVLATDLSAEEFTVEELWTLYRVRWQIELVFKRWKSVLQLDRSQARHHPHRRLTELYAKLLGCLVAHWGTLLRCGLLSKYSLHQILKRVQRVIDRLQWELAAESRQGVFAVLQDLAQRLDRLKPRPRRKKNPGTLELLLNPKLAF